MPYNQNNYIWIKVLNGKELYYKLIYRVIFIQVGVWDGIKTKENKEKILRINI